MIFPSPTSRWTLFSVTSSTLSVWRTNGPLLVKVTRDVASEKETVQRGGWVTRPRVLWRERQGQGGSSGAPRAGRLFRGTQGREALPGQVWLHSWTSFLVMKTGERDPASIGATWTDGWHLPGRPEKSLSIRAGGTRSPCRRLPTPVLYKNNVLTSVPEMSLPVWSLGLLQPFGHPFPPWSGVGCSHNLHLVLGLWAWLSRSVRIYCNSSSRQTPAPGNVAVNETGK